MWPIINQRDRRVDPFHELNRLHQQVNRLFDGAGSSGSSFPAINVRGNAEQVVVSAEVPGIDPDKLDITVSGNTLTFEGDRAAEELTEKDVVYRRERPAGRFVRTVRLPYEVDQDRITARYEQGILRVTLPRSEATKPRKISVEA